MVCRVKKNDLITPTLRALHWLSTHPGIEYEILCLVFNPQHGDAPQELVNVVRHYQPVRLSQWASQNQLVKPVSNQGYGDHAFAIVGPRLWNSLPLSLRGCRSLQSFKRGLKTHLIKIGHGTVECNSKPIEMFLFFLNLYFRELLVTLSRGLVLLRKGPYERLRGDIGLYKCFCCSLPACLSFFLSVCLPSIYNMVAEYGVVRTFCTPIKTIKNRMDPFTHFGNK